MSVPLIGEIVPSTTTVTSALDQVLLFTDGSPAMGTATSWCRLLADGLGVELRLVHVMQADLPRHHAMADEVREQAAEAGLAADVLACDREDGMHIDRPVARALAAAPTALGCFASSNLRGLVRTMLPSVTAQVLAAVPRPAAVFGPACAPAGRIDRVIACVDGSELAGQALPVAVGLARQLGVPLTLVEVVDPGWRTPQDAIEAATVRKAAYELRAQGVDASWEVLHGRHVGEAIAEWANVHPGTIIALATHGRGGLVEAVMGSVAHDVLRLAHGPVLIVRPRPRAHALEPSHG